MSVFYELSLCEQAGRISRRLFADGRAVVRDFAKKLDERCQDVGGRRYYPDAPTGTLVVAFTVSSLLSRQHILNVPLRQFLAWGRDGLEEMRGQPATPADWLTAALADHSTTLVAFDFVGILALAETDGPDMRAVLADIAYAAAQRGLLGRIEAIAASGATPAVLLYVAANQRDPSAPRFAELVFMVGALPPPLPRALATTAKMGA